MCCGAGFLSRTTWGQGVVWPLLVDTLCPLAPAVHVIVIIIIMEAGSCVAAGPRSGVMQEALLRLGGVEFLG